MKHSFFFTHNHSTPETPREQERYYLSLRAFLMEHYNDISQTKRVYSFKWATQVTESEYTVGVNCVAIFEYLVYGKPSFLIHEFSGSNTYFTPETIFSDIVYFEGYDN